MKARLFSVVVCILCVTATCLAADPPVYTAEVGIDCDAQGYEIKSTGHLIVRELRLLLGHETGKIKMSSGRMGTEDVIAVSNVVSIARSSLGLRTALQHTEDGTGDLEIRNTIEIRNHREFCEMFESGIELALYSGSLNAAKIILARGKYSEHQNHWRRNVVRPATEAERLVAIDLIGVKYFESLKELLSNSFQNFLKWQSDLPYRVRVLSA